MTDGVTTPITTGTKFKTKDTGTNGHMPVHVINDSAEGEILGVKTDAANTATDNTSVSFMSVLKQLSASIQVLAGIVGSSKAAVKAASGDFADGSIATLGTKADAANTATDTTAVSAVSIWKQISKSIQALAAGLGATAAAVPANAMQIGGKAISSEEAAATAGNLRSLITDLVGKLIVLPYANPENFVSGAITSAMTGTASTSLVGAPGSGLRNYITTIICSNSHATVGTDIVIQDGNGGATMLTIPAAAVYGGAIITLPTPLRQPTANTAIYCANVTTGASTKVSAVGYKGA